MGQFVKGNRVAVGQGRPKGIAQNVVESINNDLKVKVRKDAKDMIDKQLERAKAGHLPAFIYLFDRVLGRPVESFKIAQVVRLVMGKED